MNHHFDPNICYQCGGDCREENGRLVCRHCGSCRPQAVTGEEMTLLYTAFQKLRLADFLDAGRAFDDIIRKYPRCFQAYWGRLMARYGIKYEEDCDGKRIPTCYAASMESVFDSSDYRNALQYADSASASVYREHAQYMERVRAEWVEKAQKEPPYDIFISYKDSDPARGCSRTEDSIAMQELYIHLTGKGYRVFFSRESLRGKVGEKYEPYIYGAISTAKVMLVYGSDPDYINSTWVKNEWTRYQKRMQAGEKAPNSLIVAYKGFSPADLPLVLSSVQCMNADTPRFYSDLTDAVARIASAERKPTAPVSQTAERKTPSKGLKYVGYNNAALFHIGTCTDTDIVIPEGVREILSDAFKDCEQPERVRIPDSVVKIEPNAFDGCTNLKSVIFGKNLQFIGCEAFRGCTSLQKVILPSGLQMICEAAFYCCHSLTEVSIPDSVTGLGPNAFGMCRNLTGVRYRGTKKSWNAMNRNRRWKHKSPIRTVECMDATVSLLF